MKTPHKHAELIKAWADGAEIETLRCRITNNWCLVDVPVWYVNSEYRIKPEPKLDVVAYIEVRHVFSATQKPNHNLQVTFDGETGKLKSAEVI